MEYAPESQPSQKMLFLQRGMCRLVVEYSKYYKVLSRTQCSRYASDKTRPPRMPESRNTEQFRDLCDRGVIAGVLHSVVKIE